jgi:hypothetical protein
MVKEGKVIAFTTRSPQYVCMPLTKHTNRDSQAYGSSEECLGGISTNELTIVSNKLTTTELTKMVPYSKKPYI